MSDRLNDLSLAEYVKASTMIGFCGGVSLAIFTFLYGMFEWEVKQLMLNVLLALFASTGAFTVQGLVGYPVYWYTRKKVADKRGERNE